MEVGEEWNQLLCNARRNANSFTQLSIDKMSRNMVEGMMRRYTIVEENNTRELRETVSVIQKVLKLFHLSKPWQ